MADEIVERRQRVSSYALIIRDEHILLALTAPGYPGAGSWTLPGGGLDWGEHPEAAMHRELYEETGLTGRVVSLLGIDSFSLERKVDGRLVGFHALRVVYLVDAKGDPQVTEADGSVSESRWIPMEQVAEVPVVELVSRALEMWAPQA